MLTTLLIVFGAVLLLHAWRIVSSARAPVHKALVLIGNALYGLALAAFLFPPTSSAPAQRLVVLTPHATMAEIRRATRASQALVIGEVALSARERRRIKAVPDVAAARAAVPNAEVWNVLGAGLPPASNVGDVAIEFTPPAHPPGVRDAQWPQRLRPGETFTVNGSVSETTPATASVALLDPSGEAVATATPDDAGQFALSAATKAAGGVLFELRVSADDETVIEQVPLPVDIRTPEAVRILVRAAAPSFEIRYLKDWARRGGAAMVIDTTLSRDKQRREYVNHDAVTGTDVDAALLSQFDLVILDARAFDALDVQAARALESLMASTRLGAIVIGAGETPLTASERRPATAAATATTVAVALPGASGTQVGVSARFSDGRGEVVLRALTGEPLAKRVAAGDSAWVFSLIEDSHRWITAGQPNTHATYWNTLIDAALPPRAPVTISTSPTTPYAQQKTLLCLRGSQTNRVDIQADNATPQPLTLSPVAQRPGERCGLVYPDAGWHTVRAAGRRVARLFVLGENDGSAQRQSLATEFTRQLAARDTPPAREQTSTNEWPRWPFALLSLVLAAALWFEQRRLSV